MHNDITIRKASLSELDTLIKWRMEVLHSVFSFPEDIDTTELRQANIDYYKRALTEDSHIACFAETKGKIVGCG